MFIANTLKCRPPQNRDPQPTRSSACQDWLFAKLELIAPTVVCTLGNFSTKLLRGDPTGITQLHGRAEVRTIGPRAVRLLPLFHPAAALYTPQQREVLREDFRRIPELLALGDARAARRAEELDAPAVAAPVPDVPAPEVAVEAAEESPQLGLF